MKPYKWILAFIILHKCVYAQVVGGQIPIINGSFEGVPGPIDSSINGWTQCYSNEGVLGRAIVPWNNLVTLPPYQGNTYLEFSYYPPQQGDTSGIAEDSIYQKLVCSMLAGRNHRITVAIYTVSEDTFGQFGYSVLQLYGGNQPCSTQQLLWQSPATTNQWQVYTANFVPDSSWKYLIIKPFSLDGVDTNIGVDAMSNITVDSMPAGYCDTLTDISTLTQAAKLMRVLPNPASNKFSIVYHADEGNSMLQIFNNLGQQIAERKLTNAFGMEEFDSSKMEDGLYYIRWNDLNGKRLGYAKLIITR